MPELDEPDRLEPRDLLLELRLLELRLLELPDLLLEERDEEPELLDELDPEDP